MSYTNDTDKTKAMKSEREIQAEISEIDKMLGTKKKVRPMELRKSGTSEGACKGHKTKGHETSCDGGKNVPEGKEQGIKTHGDKAPEGVKGIAPKKNRDEHEATKETDDYDNRWRKAQRLIDEYHDTATKLDSYGRNLNGTRSAMLSDEARQKGVQRMVQISNEVEALGFTVYPSKITDKDGYTIGYTHQKSLK